MKCGIRFSQILLLLFLNCQLQAQEQSRELIDSLLNNAYNKLQSEKYRHEDAVMLLQFRTVINQFEVKTAFTKTFSQQMPNYVQYVPAITFNSYAGSAESVYQRIKILTQKGAEDYSKIYIPKSTSGKLIQITAKTIKPDGKILKVNQEDIREVQNMTNGEFNWEQAHYRFSVPGVEAGDELEIIYTVQTNFNTGDSYFFNTYIPVIQSTLTLIFSNTINPSIKNYNGLQRAKEGFDHEYNWYEYTRYELAALREVDHFIPYNELPYCRYQIISVNDPLSLRGDKINVSEPNWNDFSRKFVISRQTEKLKGRQLKSFNKFMADHYKAGVDSPVIALQKIMKVISDSIKIDNNAGKGIYGLEYDISKMSLSMLALFRFYTDVFSRLGIKYFYCLGSSKDMGRLDTSFVSDKYFSNYFYAYRDESDSLHFVFPENHFLKIGPEEINPFYFNSNVLMMDSWPQGQHSFTKVPDYLATTNFKVRKNQILVDFDENRLIFYGHTVKAGAFSFFDRVYSSISKDSLNQNLKIYFQNEIKNFTLDTTYFSKPDTVFPYKNYFNYKGTQNGRMVRVDDSLYSIDLSEWIDHSVLPIHSTSDRFVDYYPDFRYYEQFSYYYTFKIPVEIQNQESLTGGVTNDFGSYRFLLKQLSDTVVLIQSTYKIMKEKLPFYDYDQLKAIYDSWSLYKNASFLVRIKSPALTGKEMK